MGSAAVFRCSEDSSLAVKARKNAFAIEHPLTSRVQSVGVAVVATRISDIIVDPQRLEFRLEFDADDSRCIEQDVGIGEARLHG
jgi:hypothetical protein